MARQREDNSNVTFTNSLYIIFYQQIAVVKKVAKYTKYKNW